MTNPNDPAFLDKPSTFYVRPDIDTSYGLTKREYFAALAMQSVLTSLSQYNNEKDDKIINRNLVAELSCIYADALIAELNKTHETA